MKVVSQFLVAKTGEAEECEDGIVVTEDFAAVIDGATDTTGRRYSGITAGRYAMLACAGAIRMLNAKADAETAISHLTEILAENLPLNSPPGENPAAVAVIYSEARREIWQIGDVGFWYAGVPDGGVKPRKTIDRYAADIRAAVLRAELANGADPATLAQADPGREAILSLLTHQSIFCNNAGAGEWAYAALDGRPVAFDLVTVQPVPDDVNTVVIASDGYPVILPTLQASEELLASLLSEDSLCIGSLLGTKGVFPGNASYDDRAYLSIRILILRLPRLTLFSAPPTATSPPAPAPSPAWPSARTDHQLPQQNAAVRTG
jgi:hypothetical protein